MLHLDDSNPLLGNFGTQGREFISSLHQIATETFDVSASPGRNSLLNAIQEDLLNLSQPSNNRSTYEISNSDKSIRIHDCHSRYREIQVLYDNMLDFFNNDPILLPNEIIVMAPDIERYASAVRAIFGNPENESKRIPFSIADRNEATGCHYADAFLKMVHIPEQRLTANELMLLLTNESICRKFGFSNSDTDIIREWFTKLHISWGLDLKHLKELDFPLDDTHTLTAASERLLLGFMLPHNRDAEAFGRWPYPLVEGDRAELAGRISAFLSTLRLIKETLSQKLTAAEWSDKLIELLNLWAEQNDDENTENIINIIKNLKESSIAAKLVTPLPFALFRKHIVDRISRSSSSRGFLSTGITFCSMLPMRCIPFKGIALLGMDTAFPRETFPVSFDLMRTAGARRKGDRSREQDDRYIFLETILSARNWLHISYVGRDIEKNSTIPPSSLVDELVEYITANCSNQRDSIVNSLFVRHPLHAYSSLYFSEKISLFTYSDTNAAIRSSANNFNKADRLFCPVAISAPVTTEPVTVSPEFFAEAFLNPSRFFMERGMNLRLERTLESLPDHEPFVIGARESAGLKRALIKTSSVDTNTLYRKSTLSALLPPANMGEFAWDATINDARSIIEKSQQFLADTILVDTDINITLSNICIKGTIKSYKGDDSFVLVNPVKTTPLHLLKTWLFHNMLNCMHEGKKTIFIDKECKISTFLPCSNSIILLEQLKIILDKAYTEPLAFSPATSFKYAEMLLLKRLSTSKALSVAQDEWLKENDGYLKFVWSRRAIMDHPLFSTVACQVFDPFFASMEVKKK
jgi:exodeoxyribonuclease V gamma subunit